MKTKLNKKLILSLTVFTSLVLGGCAKSLPPPEGSALLPEIDVVQVKENSDEALKLAQEAKLDVEALNSKVTELGNQITGISEDIANISVAKIEELENRTSLLTEELKQIQKLLENADIRKKTPPEKPMPTFKPGNVKENKAELKAEGAPQVEQTKSQKEPDNAGYQSALKDYNKKEYPVAIKKFKELITNDSTGVFADNCTYWVGESYYMMSDFAQAISWYKKVAKFTDTEKSDDAQYKIAKSFLKLGEKAQAVTEYENLLSLYPSSEYAVRVKEELSKLKAE